MHHHYFLPNTCMHDDMRPEFWYDELNGINVPTMDAPAFIATGSTQGYDYKGAACGSIGHMSRPGDYQSHDGPGYKEEPKAEEPAPKKTRGGKRTGAGRKALDSDGTIVTTIRLTAKQKASFDMLGGPAWLREQLDLFTS